jgi:hypothetical protein
VLTIITTFKPFEGIFNIIQRNALESWLRFIKNCDVVVVGEESGVTDVANEYGLKIVKEIKRSKFGTPLFSEIIQNGERLADYEYVCFTNGDIILLDDFVTAFNLMKQSFQEFLALSIRTNLDVTQKLNLDDQQTIKFLKAKAVESKTKRTFPSNGAGFDVFVFRRGFFKDIPPFVVGRGNAYVRWMIYQTKMRKKPVIEISPSITAIHQNHEYTHIRDPKVKALSLDKGQNAYLPTQGEEYLFNSSLLGVASYFSGGDIDYVLTHNGFVQPRSTRLLFRRVVKLPLLPPVSRVSLPLTKLIIPNRVSRSLIKKMLEKSGVLY